MPTKLDQSATPSRKAIALFGILLFSRQPLSLKGLAEQLGCSRQTVLRLMEDAERANIVNIRKWKENRENFYQAVFQSRPNLDFSQEELTQLMFCRDLVRHMLPEGHQQRLDTATDKAALLMRDASQREKIPTSIGRGVVKGAIDYTQHEAALETLMSAKNSGQVVEIEYFALNRTEPKTHAFVPMRFVAYHDGFYVRGWSVSDKGAVTITRPMTLALHRMQRIWPTRRYLTDKQPFPDEAEAFGMAKDSTPFQVMARFFPPAAQYVRERTWSCEQQLEELPDNAVQLTMTAQSELEVVKWILGFGCEAELIEPAHLRQRVAKELGGARKRYGETALNRGRTHNS